MEVMPAIYERSCILICICSPRSGNSYRASLGFRLNAAIIICQFWAALQELFKAIWRICYSFIRDPALWPEYAVPDLGTVIEYHYFFPEYLVPESLLGVAFLVLRGGVYISLWIIRR